LNCPGRNAAIIILAADRAARLAWLPSGDLCRSRHDAQLSSIGIAAPLSLSSRLRLR